MNGFNLAEGGHSANIFPPASISGGVNANPFSMKGHGHASVIISFGARGAANPTALIVNACTSNAAANPTPINFRVYSIPGGQGNDVVSGPTVTTAAATGFTAWPANVANYTFIVEIDSSEVQAAVEAGGAESPWIQVQLTDSGNATTAGISVVLSGARQAFRGSPTATA